MDKEQASEPIARRKSGSRSSLKNDEILGLIQSLKSEIDDLKQGLNEQAAKHQQAMNEQAAKHQQAMNQALNEQAAKHQQAMSQKEAALKVSSDQIEELKEKVEDLKIELRKATGQSPKSERNRGNPSAGNCNGGGGGNDDDGDQSGQPDRELSNKEKYDLACTAYKKKKLQQRDFEVEQGRKPSDSNLAWHIKMGSDMSLVPAAEHQMDCPIGQCREVTHPVNTFEKQAPREAFGTTNGIKVDTVSTTRFGFRIESTVEHIKYQVATLREPEGDDDQDYRSPSICAGIGVHGPPKTQVTWEGMANALILCSTFAVPMERVGRIVGNPYFNAKNISRWAQQCAWHLLPIYLWLFGELSRARVIRMDDTNIIVQEMSRLIEKGVLIADSELDKQEGAWDKHITLLRKIADTRKVPHLVAETAAAMGRVSSYKGTDQGKQSYNLSCVSWLLDPSDVRSTVLLFRTHFGSCCNLVANALASRSSKNKDPVRVIADAATVNGFEPHLERWIKIIYQHCYHHARRHVKAFEAIDRELASYLLERFMRLDELEFDAFTAPATRSKVEKERRKAKELWQDIKRVAEHVVMGKKHPEARNALWKKGTKAYKGCRYIIKHYETLTLYLSDANLSGNNTFIERALRPQKRIMEAAPVRKSESSQYGFDIIRTFSSTCECAGKNFKEFLRNTMNTPRAEIEANPGKYAPFSKAAAYLT